MADIPPKPATSDRPTSRTEAPVNLPARYKREIPEGDSRLRIVCSDCGFINYENPKVVVGAVVREGDRILMCRRAINPRHGFWTLPAGYLELNETTADGARREAWEEARAKIEIDGLIAVYSIPRLSQVQVIYRARFAAPGIEPGPESLEVGLFAWDEIPWNDLAFPSVRWALEHYREVGDAEHFAARTNPPGELGNF
ncbi:NUDIX hydrolase [Hypericibacter terrae]|uniref:NUDIX hydrolase n=1 Tax=Hypericibacter terrae TaxID=2602015 RepID=A0A5J6MPP9_9PROT|nr:NUDIX hydrolase [Hypericibacter terrae]QEX19612.1 NUDIX hydrolase [Hypericibacter terrae]